MPIPQEAKLTPEERANIVLKYGSYKGKLQKVAIDVSDAASAEGYRAGIKRVVDWSVTLCPHSWGKYPNHCSKKGCQRCWEQLLKELEK